MPSLKCTEDECLADFVLRKNTRLNNPGACSLEFQSIMQILTECMLKWDIKSKSSTGKGILGTQCKHLLVQTKNKVVKHFIDTGKFGWRISIKHYEMLCLIITKTQGTKLDKHLRNISTTLSAQVMVPNFVSHTNASAKVMTKYRKLIFLKISSRRKTLSVFKKLDAKSYVTTLEEG